MKRVESNSKDYVGSTQKEVLNMLTKKFYTIKKIAELRRVSVQSVYKIVQKLRKKGLITRSFTRGLKKVRRTNPHKGFKIRLHNQQFKIKILQKSDFYNKLLVRKNQMFLDANTVQLYPNSIIVSCNELRDFWGDTPDHAKIISSEYWNKLFWELQDKLKVIIIKGENTSIKQFNGHFAEVNNELAKDCNEKRAKIIIRGEEDGLAWLIADKSWDIFNELEGIHPSKAQEDMQEVVQPFFNNLRANKGYTPKLVLDLIGELIEDRKYYAENLRSHVTAIKQLGTSVGKVKAQVDRLNRRLDQKKLKEWL